MGQKLTSKQITDYVIAYKLTDDEKVKAKIEQIVIDNMHGLVGHIYGHMRGIQTAEWEDFKSECAISILKAMDD